MDTQKARNLFMALSPPRERNATIACLQETHLIDKFTLDTSYKGGYLLDDSERNSQGVAILFPTRYELIGSQISGPGRWAFAALKDSMNTSYPVLIIASVYAPNCHRAALPFYMD